MADTAFRSPEAPEASLPHRADPLSKLILLLCVVLLAMHGEQPLFQLGLLAVLVTAALLAGLSAKEIGVRLGLLLAVAFPLFVLTWFAAPAGEVLASAGPVKLTAGGFDAAAVVALRLLSLFLSSYIYISTTSPRDFVYMLTQWLKVPYRLAFGVSVALAFLPLLEKEAAIALSARKIRGGARPKGIRERIRLLLGLSVKLFEAALRRVQHTAGAMEAKGFGAYKTRTFMYGIRFTRGSLALSSCAAAATAGLWMIV